MDILFRFLGLATPVVLPLIGFGIEHRWDEAFAGPRTAVIGIFGVGVVTGLLLRRWWAIGYAPTAVIVLVVAAQLATSDADMTSTRPPEVSPWLLLTVLALVPIAFGAALGVRVGTAIARNEPRTSNPS